MGISLKKGGSVSLSKSAPGLRKIRVGLGWDARDARGTALDLDASVFCLAGQGRVESSNDLIFYNNLKSVDGAIAHTGDNRTGAGDGDDETVLVDLSQVRASIISLLFAVTIQDGDTANITFKNVANAFLRIIDENSGKEVARYDLAERFSAETGVIVGDVCRAGNEWHFRAVGHGFQGGLAALCQHYGVDVG